MLSDALMKYEDEERMNKQSGQTTIARNTSTLDSTLDSDFHAKIPVLGKKVTVEVRAGNIFQLLFSNMN